jgi:hypothetical protein
MNSNLGSASMAYVFAKMARFNDKNKGLDRWKDAKLN